MAQNKSDTTLATVITNFDKSWEYTAGSWHERWNNNFYLYNNNRVKRGYKGITDTFVPMVFSTVEMMTSALFGTKPRFDYIPPSDKQDQNTEILNSLLDYYWDKDKWSIKIINWGRDMFRYGTSVVYMHWNNDYPCMLNVPIRDFFIDPTASSLENAKYMGRRYLTTKEELEQYEVVDLEKSKGDNVVMKKKYTNLDKIKAQAQGENTDKQEKDMWYGSTITNPDENGQLEVIEYWTEDRVISVANRSVVIEDAENYYKKKAKDNGEKYPKGLMPFACLRDYVDGSLFYAKGEVDFLADQQELLNDLTNQNIDSITFTLNQMYTIDPKYAHMAKQIENLPGAVYPVEAGTLQPIPMGNVPQDAFNERLNIKSEMRETSASNEIVKGVGQEGGKVTATEIQAQIAGAGQRMGLKVTQVEDEGFHRLAEIVFSMVRLYVNKPQMVRIVGKDGVRWEEFEPTEFKEGDYEPRVQLETTVNSEKQAQGEMAKEMFGAFLNDPDVNQVELKKLALQRSFDLDPDEVQLLMTPPEGMDMMGMEGELPPEMPMQPELPPEPMLPEEMPMETPAAMADPITITDPVTGEPITVIQDPMTGEMIEVTIDPITGELMPMAEEPMGVM